MIGAYLQTGPATAPPPTPSADRTYLGWQDTDKTRPTVDKLADGIARFIEKFGRQPTVVLCNIVDAEDLREAGVELAVRDVLFLGTRGTFYIGSEGSL